MLGPVFTLGMGPGPRKPTVLWEAAQPSGTRWQLPDLLCLLLQEQANKSSMPFSDHCKDASPHWPTLA